MRTFFRKFPALIHFFILRQRICPGIVLVVFVMSAAMILSAGSFAAEPRRIVLEGDVWPPYVMDPREGRNGFIVDVAKAALAKAGYEVVYLNVPWTRSLIDTAKRKCDGSVGIYFSDAVQRKFVIPDEELGVSVNKFYVRRKSHWQYSGIQSLASVTLGVIDSYDYGEINAYVDAQRNAGSPKVSFMFGDKALERNIKKLLLGDRIDAIVEDQLVVAYVSSRMGIRAAIKEAGTALPYNKVGVAFSPNTPKSAEYSAALSRGVRQLRASGELDAILKGYQVSDWKFLE